MDESLQDLADLISAQIGHSITSSRIAFDELTVTCTRQGLHGVLRHLRDEPTCSFCCLIDICGADYPGRDERFEVVYHLLSPYQNARIRVKVSAGEDDAVPSSADLFPAANWFEREAFDLYGIKFSGHPDLRRILTDYGFAGHPLRKDFPLTGHVEVRYDDEAKKVVYEPVKLVQEFRNFDYLSPWEGTDYVLPGDEKAKPNGEGHGQ